MFVGHNWWKNSTIYEEEGWGWLPYFYYSKLESVAELEMDELGIFLAAPLMTDE